MSFDNLLSTPLGRMAFYEATLAVRLLQIWRTVSTMTFIPIETDAVDARRRRTSAPERSVPADASAAVLLWRSQQSSLSRFLSCLSISGPKLKAAVWLSQKFHRETLAKVLARIRDCDVSKSTNLLRVSFCKRVSCLISFAARPAERRASVSVRGRAARRRRRGAAVVDCVGVAS